MAADFRFASDTTRFLAYGIDGLVIGEKSNVIPFYLSVKFHLAFDLIGFVDVIVTEPAKKRARHRLDPGIECRTEAAVLLLDQLDAVYVAKCYRPRRVVGAVVNDDHLDIGISLI